MKHLKHLPSRQVTLAAMATAALLAGCGMLRSPFPTHPEPTVTPPTGTQPGTGAQPNAQPSTPTSPSGGTGQGTQTPPTVDSNSGATPPSASSPTVRARPSAAADPKAYRKDAAAHIYANNPARIYKGKLPPLLYAIGVLEVDIDAQGRVGKIFWKRAPSQAPEVMAEIEKIVRAAAPFPVPARMGKVTYTDVWLWDEDGKFQLDTLTEGQL